MNTQKTPTPHLFTYHSANQNANMQLLEREIMKGLKPKWYCVLHFNDGASSARQQARRVDEREVENDLQVVKDALYTELYGRKWRKKKRSRSIWGIEYGRNHLKPHINLIIEALPHPYDDYRSCFVLFDRLLPKMCRCLWMRSAHVQPVDIDTFSRVSSYCCKEADYRNSTINYNLTDFIV